MINLSGDEHQMDAFVWANYKATEPRAHQANGTAGLFVIRSRCRTPPGRRAR